MRPISACAESAAALRSANGFSRATMKALFGSDAPSSSEKPMTASTCSTAGICFSRSSTCWVDFAGARHRRAVRQLHRNEEGALVFLRKEARRGQKRHAVDADGEHQRRSTSDSPAMRTSRPTTAGVAVANPVDAAAARAP